MPWSKIIMHNLEKRFERLLCKNFFFLVLFVGLFQDLHAHKVKFNINRLQLMQTLDKKTRLQFSSFTMYEGDWYSLQYVEVGNSLFHAKNYYLFFENYIGFPSLIKLENFKAGLVTRTQSVYEERLSSTNLSQSFGIQLGLSGVLTSNKPFETFIQYYPFKIMNSKITSTDILHYYSVKNIIQNISLRGYNYFYFFEHKTAKGNKIFYKLQIDVIYQLNKFINLTARYWFQNDDLLDAKSGSNFALGVRYSF